MLFNPPSSNFALTYARATLDYGRACPLSVLIKFITMLYQSIYLFVVALVLAFLEVQIEGQHGWAAKLPTWRPEGKWYAKIFGFFLGGNELTGYHIGIFSLVLLFLHYPYFYGTQWSWFNEAWTFSIFFLFSAIWDYLWIIINPYYGVWRRKPRKDMWWHKRWWGPFPEVYYTGTLVSLAVLTPWWWGEWSNPSVLREWGIMFGIFVLGTSLTLLFVEIFRGDIDR